MAAQGFAMPEAKHDMKIRRSQVTIILRSSFYSVKTIYSHSQLLRTFRLTVIRVVYRDHTISEPSTTK